MYEENSYKLKIDWKALIIRAILVLLFIILVIWLFPMPKLDTFYNRIFNENINTMSTAAKNYFNNNLPQDIGDTSTIKLEEMINKNLLIEFKDKNNESCNKTNSFAQITKTGTNDYVLKTQLSCQDETDYVLETLNTTTPNTSNTNTTTTDNQNKNNNTNTSNTTNTNIKNSINNDEDDDEDIIKDDVTYDKDGNIIGIIEYEFKKPIYSSTKSYYCPNGYVLEGKTCYKEETDETIEATKEYTGKEIETWQYWLNERTNEKLNGEYYKEYFNGAPLIPITKPYFNGWAGSLEIGVIKNDKVVPIGYLSGLSDEIKANYKDYKGKVIEVGAMEVLETGGLRHAKMLNFRPDLTIKECTWEKIWGNENK